MAVFDYWLNAQQFGMPRPQQAPVQQGQINRMMPQGMPQRQQPMQPMQQQAPMGAPLNAGANIARQSTEMQQPGFLQTIGNLISDFGTAGLRASQVPIAREIGMMQKTSGEKAEEMKRQHMLMAMLEQKEEAARHKHEMENRKLRHAENVLGETRRHHDMMASDRREARSRASNEDRRQEQEIRAVEQIQKVHPDAIPYTKSMPAKERADFTKDLQVRVKEPLGFKNQLNIVDEMLDIVEKNPNISTSFSALIDGKGVVSKWGMSEKDRIDLEKLNNLQRRLALTKVESGVGGARMTVFLEKLINESKVHGGLHPDTIKAYKKNMKSEYKHLLEDSQVARSALRGHKGIRYYVPRPEDIYRDPDENKKNIQGISDEELWRASGL